MKIIGKLTSAELTARTKKSKKTHQQVHIEQKVKNLKAKWGIK